MQTSLVPRILQQGKISPIRSHSNGVLRWRHALLVASTLSLHPNTTVTAGFAGRPYFTTTHPFHPTNIRRTPSTTTEYDHSQQISTSTTKRYMSKEEEEGKINNDDITSSDTPNPSSMIQDPREFILSKCPEPEDREILRKTMDWVQNVVIGLNFCPFAEKPFRSKQLHLEVLSGTDETEILTRVLGECLVRQTNPGTSLMICPDLYPMRFDTFLQVYNILNEGVLVDNDLTDDVQIAPFHPLFEFEGSGSDGIDNYTNRSPYPIFHILREEEVGRAVDLLDGDASKVWRRNVEFLEALGDELENDQFQQVMVGKPVDTTIQEKVKDILRDLKKKNKGYSME